MSFCYHRFIAERHPLLCEPRLYRIRAISQCLSLYCLITLLNGLNWWTKFCALVQCPIIIFDYLYISIFWCPLRIRESFDWDNNCTNVQVIWITITKVLAHPIYIIVFMCVTINFLHTRTFTRHEQIAAIRTARGTRHINKIFLQFHLC